MESFEIRLRLLFYSSYVTLSQPVEKKLERGIDLETIYMAEGACSTSKTGVA